MSTRKPTSDLGLIARLNGTTVTALARRIGRSRMQCYRAWASPSASKTRIRLMGALKIKEVPSAK